MRFAPSQPAEGAPGHVHFEEKLRDSAVMVTQEKDGHFLVKVGARGARAGAAAICGRAPGGGPQVPCGLGTPLRGWQRGSSGHGYKGGALLQIHRENP